jgi:cytochrome c553
MKSIVALFLICASLVAHADPFADGNVAAGKKLFDQNNCNRCHMNIMGGDGNAIFTRPDRKVNSPEQLVAQMHVCSGNVGITLSNQDEQNLGAYLNRNFYHFK